MRNVGVTGMDKESKYQANLIKKITKMLPDSIVLKNDPNYKQGIPDLLVLEGDGWATLEVKQHAKAKHRPNQDYYVERMNQMSYSAFIYPENEEEILDEMVGSLKLRRKARIPKS